MFHRDANDSRVVNIIDFNHMAYNVAYGAKSLSTTLMIDGVPQIVDTTIPALTIKTIHRWANKGLNPTAVCFDTKGSGTFRAHYFKKMSEKTGGEIIDYKNSRTSADDKFYKGINLTANFLHEGGVACYKNPGYEADDLIKACIDRAKEMYPTLPIHVITGDTDLVPLVDDQVSVFLRSRKFTYATEKAFEKNKYVQITPESYQYYIEDTSAIKQSKLHVPYNTLLLAKILRGDSSDKIPGKSDWKPKMYNTLIQLLIDDGVDIANLFRYGKSTETLCYRDSGMPIPAELINSTPRENMMIHFGDPVELTNMLEVLSRYVEPEDLEYIRFKYLGMNLNGAITGMEEGKNRRPANIKTDIKGYMAGELQQAVIRLKINLPQ
mgnify:CR=1 FL=1